MTILIRAEDFNGWNRRGVVEQLVRDPYSQWDKFYVMELGIEGVTGFGSHLKVDLPNLHLGGGGHKLKTGLLQNPSFSKFFSVVLQPRSVCRITQTRVM